MASAMRDLLRPVWQSITQHAITRLLNQDGGHDADKPELLLHCDRFSRKFLFAERSVLSLKHPPFAAGDLLEAQFTGLFPTDENKKRTNKYTATMVN